MTLYIVRHALAVPRRQWDGSDDERPLTSTGRAQAKRLLKWSHLHVDDARMLTSPTARCIDTVRRIAVALGVDLEQTDALRLDHETEAVELARSLLELPTDVVLCTHGEIIKPMLSALRPRMRGGQRDDRAKGSVWALRSDHGRLTARYTPNRQLPTSRAAARHEHTN